MKISVLSFFKNILDFIVIRKVTFSVTSVLVVLSVTATSFAAMNNITPAKPVKNNFSVPSSTDEVSSEETPDFDETPPEDNISTEDAVSSTQSAVTVTKPPKQTTVSTVSKVPAASSTNYKYNSNMSPDNNVFLDALIYTGYNIQKHRVDGNMWKYVLAGKKRGLGYLSKIGYGGGSSGYETDSAGKPDIAKFERGGLVCASFATYVYFNYLPNVAGIDTSSLTRPSNPTFANDWYTAVKDWVNKGYSEYISFSSKVTGATGNSYIVFNPSRDIPIGSVIIFRNPKKAATYGAHVAIYAGTVNGYHWLLHVGTSNGPEFCAVERMNFGPNPRWPIAVVTPPSNIRFSPVLEIELTDDSGAPIAGATFSLKNADGNITVIGTTGSDGKIVKSDLSYGSFELLQTVPVGYTCESPVQSILLNTLNNSYNKITVTDIKDKLPEEETPDKSESDSEKTDSETVDTTLPENCKKPENKDTNSDSGNGNSDS